MNRASILALCLAWTAPVARADIVITEVHYAPVAPDGSALPELEFVEVFNDGSEPFDLSGFRFTNGIFYEFEPGTFIPDGGYLAVCRDSAALKAAHGIANAVGDFTGILDNAGETIELGNPQGITVSRVSYSDRGRWPSGAKGTGHSLSILTPYSDPGDADSWILSQSAGGSPGRENFGTQATFQDTALIPAGSAWRYFKGTQEPSNPTTSWRQVGFNDGSWLSGATGIGYGDGDDVTVLNDMEGNYRTIFCRKTFAVADTGEIEDLVLTISYDDGFYAFLNGTLVASRNVSSMAFNADAPEAGEPASEDIDISAFKAELANGTNILAIQVHNAGLNSSDLSFGPALVSRKVTPPTEHESIPVVINEGYVLTGGAGTRFIELYNTSAQSIGLGGYHLTDDFADLGKYAIPAGTSLPAHGRLAFTEAQTGLDLALVPGVRDDVPVALSNPAGTRVVDAVIFDSTAPGTSMARLPDGTRGLQPAATPTPGGPNAVATTASVVIHEILYHPMSGDPRDEFIELFNRGAAAVDLSGWELEGVGLILPPGTSIPAGGYLVLCKDPGPIRSRYSLTAAVVPDAPWAGVLADGGERLRLLDPLGNTADQVSYRDGGEWPLWPDGGGSSLELVDAFSDNAVAGSWDSSDDSSEASTAMITYSNVPYGGAESDFGMMLAERGIAIIDDITLQRTTGGANLINNGTFDAGTSPWRIEGTHIRSGRTTVPGAVIAGGGSLKLICFNGSGDYKVNRIEEDTAAQTSGLHTVSYKARWVVGSNRIITIGDYSTGAPDNPGLAGSNAVPVPATLGTPGAVNSATARRVARLGSFNMGPAIDAVSHSPGVPAGGESVQVVARCADPDGVSLVRLYFRTEAPGGPFTQVAMSDADGDGIYTGSIPGQALGIRVLYYVQATDGSGAVSRFPADPFERAHPPFLNPSSPAPGDYRYCMYRHDTPIVSTSHHSYRFVLDQASEDYLRTRRTHSNEMIDGTFIFGSGDVYQSAQIRYAGSPWLREGNFNNSYALRMPKDNPLHGRKETFNLDEHGSDGKERLAHYLLRQSAGSTTLPYFAFHTLVRFQLNDVKTATYEALDKPNGDYISFWFPTDDDGPNFEMDDRFSFNDSGNRTGNVDGRVLFPPYGSTAGGENAENYRWFFSPRSRESEDDFTQLEYLAYVLDSRITANPDFDQAIFQIMDVEEVLRVWAVRMNIDDWDTWGGRRGKNCYHYLSPTDGLWRLVPWDLELTFGDVNAFGLPSTITGTYGNFFSEVTRMINRPLIKRMYYGLLAEQVDASTGFFHSGFLAPYMQTLAAAGVGSLNAGLPGGYIDQRANLIRNWVRSAAYPQVRLEVTTNGGANFSVPATSTGLAGIAPVDVFFIAIVRNGEVLDHEVLDLRFSTTNHTGWTVETIPLGPGLNTIEVIGLSSRGDLVDTDSIEVTSTVSWNAPSISAIAPAAAPVGDLVEILGADYHTGVRVFFGAVEAAEVSFNEQASTTRIVVRVPEGLADGAVSVTVRNVDGQESGAAAFTVSEPLARFIRGDSNGDGGVDLSDAVATLLHLFAGLDVPCLDALDADDSGAVALTDAVRVLDYLFRSGPAPAAPFPASGTDPTPADPLGCEEEGS